MYAYSELLEDERELASLGYQVEYIGKTVYGKLIPAFTRGNSPQALIVGGTHARENITSKLVATLAKEYTGDNICFLPLLNIDGAEIVKRGESAVPKKYIDLVKSCKGESYSLWKANGRGVDINVNYNADWGSGKSNIFKPNFENYVGKSPNSEPETLASVNLVYKYRFDTLLTYHTKGEVIYRNYKGVGDENRANLLYQKLGYPLLESTGSAGGFKDWFIKEGFGDGFTIEVGSNFCSHPLDDKDFDQIYRQNAGICELICGEKWNKTKNL